MSWTWRRPRVGAALVAAALACGSFAAAAYAATATITNNQATDHTGAYGPAHSLTRVYVHDGGGSSSACEDAYSGGWVQSAHGCVDNGAETWHDFCGCAVRQGWNGSRDAGLSETMTGHETW